MDYGQKSEDSNYENWKWGITTDSIELGLEESPVTNCTPTSGITYMKWKNS